MSQACLLAPTQGDSALDRRDTEITRAGAPWCACRLSRASQMCFVVMMCWASLLVGRMQNTSRTLPRRRIHTHACRHACPHAPSYIIRLSAGHTDLGSGISSATQSNDATNKEHHYHPNHPHRPHSNRNSNPKHNPKPNPNHNNPTHNPNHNPNHSPKHHSNQNPIHIPDSNSNHLHLLKDSLTQHPSRPPTQVSHCPKQTNDVQQTTTHNGYYYDSGWDLRSHATQRGPKIKDFEGQYGELSLEIVCKWAREAEMGDPEAQFSYSRCLQEGIHVDIDYLEAFNWLKQASENGHKDSMFLLAKAYHFGMGVKVNMERAAAWYYNAAKCGRVEAAIYLAYLFEEGLGVEKAPHCAEFWLRYAIRSESHVSPGAMFSLARLYQRWATSLEVAGLESCVMRPVIWFEGSSVGESVNERSNVSQDFDLVSSNDLPEFGYTRTIREGHETTDEKQRQKELQLLQQVELMVNENDEQEMELYGPLREKGGLGIQFKRNIIQRVFCKSLSEEKGIKQGWRIHDIAGIHASTLSTRNISSILNRLKASGLSFNMTFEYKLDTQYLWNQTVFWTKEAAIYNVSKAQFVLSRWLLPKHQTHPARPTSLQTSTPKFGYLSDRRFDNYERNPGLVSPSFEESERWLWRAAKSGSGDAWYDLGRRALALEGAGLKNKQNPPPPIRRNLSNIHDIVKPSDYFRNGAFEGHFGCMGALAHCLFFGVGGVEKVNTSQAFQLWKQAALQGGDPEALRSLARCKYDGIGCRPNVSEAVSYFQRAAEMGLSDAQVWMGSVLMEQLVAGSDEETEEKETKAFKWFEKAAKAGEAEGMYRLGICYLRGEGVLEDMAMGRTWLTNSAKLGFAAAGEALASIGG